MAYGNKIKLEHSGAKHGNGAFYGRKQEAKEFSNKKRRQADHKIANGQWDIDDEI